METKIAKYQLVPKNDNTLFIWIFSDALDTQNVPETQKYLGDDICYFPVKP